MKQCKLINAAQTVLFCYQEFIGRKESQQWVQIEGNKSEMDIDKYSAPWNKPHVLFAISSFLTDL